MVTLTRPIGPAQGKSFQTLDARTLGRPVHLLEQFTRQFGEDLAELFRVSLNRRYGAAFEIGTIQVATAGVEPPSGQRWLTYQVGDGQISYAIDRRVLLCILGYRYGTLNAPAAQAERSDAFALDAPLTATEERLAVRLATQLISVLTDRIDARQPEITGLLAAAPGQLTPSSSHAAVDPAWTVEVPIAERNYEVQGALRLRLDEHWINRLLRGLTPERPRSSKRGAVLPGIVPLAKLQVGLVARLLERQIPLGTVMDLKVGDVLPVSLGAADVLVGDARLFAASVAEHKGRLCLTSFEDVE